MATITVTLSEEMDGYVEDRIAAGGFPTRDAYVRELIRHDREQLERFRALIQDGLDSPVAGPADDAYFEGLRERIWRRAAR